MGEACSPVFFLAQQQRDLLLQMLDNSVRPLSDLQSVGYSVGLDPRNDGLGDATHLVALLQRPHGSAELSFISKKFPVGAILPTVVCVRSRPING